MQFPLLSRRDSIVKQERDKNQRQYQKNGNELRTTTRHVTSVINTNSRKLKNELNE